MDTKRGRLQVPRFRRALAVSGQDGAGGPWAVARAVRRRHARGGGHCPAVSQRRVRASAPSPGRGRVPHSPAARGALVRRDTGEDPARPPCCGAVGWTAAVGAEPVLVSAGRRHAGAPCDAPGRKYRACRSPQRGATGARRGCSGTGRWAPRRLWWPVWYCSGVFQQALDPVVDGCGALLRCEPGGRGALAGFVDK